ncbi:MAG: SRPBCC family protein [Chloroflexi bacterium]|nr:SRPBCC family protein [Chloroflexota bacterium]
MKYTYRFRVEAPVEAIYQSVLSAERWLSFVPGYQGLESGDPNWPNTGSSIVVRFRYGFWAFRFEDTVIDHEYGSRFHPYEEGLGGAYIDDVELLLQEEDGTTKVTLIRDVKARSILVWIFLVLISPISRWITPLIVKRRIKAMVERSESY